MEVVVPSVQCALVGPRPASDDKGRGFTLYEFECRIVANGATLTSWRLVRRGRQFEALHAALTAAAAHSQASGASPFGPRCPADLPSIRACLADAASSTAPGGDARGAGFDAYLQALLSSCRSSPPSASGGAGGVIWRCPELVVFLEDPAAPALTEVAATLGVGGAPPSRSSRGSSSSAAAAPAATVAAPPPPPTAAAAAPVAPAPAASSSSPSAGAVSPLEAAAREYVRAFMRTTTHTGSGSDDSEPAAGAAADAAGSGGDADAAVTTTDSTVDAAAVGRLLIMMQRMGIATGDGIPAGTSGAAGAVAGGAGGASPSPPLPPPRIDRYLCARARGISGVRLFHRPTGGGGGGASVGHAGGGGGGGGRGPLPMAGGGGSGGGGRRSGTVMMHGTTTSPSASGTSAVPSSWSPGTGTGTGALSSTPPASAAGVGAACATCGGSGSPAQGLSRAASSSSSSPSPPRGLPPLSLSALQCACGSAPPASGSAASGLASLPPLPLVALMAVAAPPGTPLATASTTTTPPAGTPLAGTGKTPSPSSSSSASVSAASASASASALGAARSPVHSGPRDASGARQCLARHVLQVRHPSHWLPVASACPVHGSGTGQGAAPPLPAVCAAVDAATGRHSGDSGAAAAAASSPVDVAFAFLESLCRGLLGQRAFLLSSGVVPATSASASGGPRFQVEVGLFLPPCMAAGSDWHVRLAEALALASLDQAAAAPSTAGGGGVVAATGVGQRGPAGPPGGSVDAAGGGGSAVGPLTPAQAVRRALATAPSPPSSLPVPPLAVGDVTLLQEQPHPAASATAAASAAAAAAVASGPTFVVACSVGPVDAVVRLNPFRHTAALAAMAALDGGSTSGGPFAAAVDLLVPRVWQALAVAASRGGGATGSSGTGSSSSSLRLSAVQCALAAALASGWRGPRPPRHAIELLLHLAAAAAGAAPSLPGGGVLCDAATGTHLMALHCYVDACALGTAHGQAAAAAAAAAATAAAAAASSSSSLPPSSSSVGGAGRPQSGGTARGSIVGTPRLDPLASVAPAAAAAAGGGGPGRGSPAAHAPPPPPPPPLALASGASPSAASTGAGARPPQPPGAPGAASTAASVASGFVSPLPTDKPLAAALLALGASAAEHAAVAAALAHVAPALATALADLVAAADAAADAATDGSADPAALAAAGAAFTAALGGVGPLPPASASASGGHPSLAFCLAYSEALLWPVVTSAGLVVMADTLLRVHGPIAVGELGKALADAFGCQSIPHMLKDAVGGLRRFLEHHADYFVVGSEHLYNPVVRLADWA